jgi:succinate-semialdehyde dehydrogenase/glutarate-semialdehyde dehydrogenase
VHESIAEHFVDLLKAKAAQLRQGSSAAGGNDLGSITFEKQKGIYDRHLQQARQNGAQVAGGEFSADRRFLKPAIVTGAQIESLDVYKEETFGPVVAVTTFKSVAEAVRKANDSKYGLLASVITRNLSLGEQIAKQLEVGTVTVNEVTYTAGLGETPWGGIKDSGIGRSHSEVGFYEFLQIRHIHVPRSRLFVFKSPWWFPYSPYQMAAFRQPNLRLRRNRR